MKYTLKIESRNDALTGSGLEVGEEVARLLRVAAARAEAGLTERDHGVLFDHNGNRVGTWEAKR